MGKTRNTHVQTHLNMDKISPKKSTLENGESSTDIFTLPNVKQIASGKQLHQLGAL